VLHEGLGHRVGIHGLAAPRLASPV
jgi:hypothetical protein